MSDHRYTVQEISRMRGAAFEIRVLNGPWQRDEALRTAEAMVLTWIAAGITPGDAEQERDRLYWGKAEREKAS